MDRPVRHLTITDLESRQTSEAQYRFVANPQSIYSHCEYDLARNDGNLAIFLVRGFADQCNPFVGRVVQLTFHNPTLRVLSRMWSDSDWTTSCAIQYARVLRVRAEQSPVEGGGEILLTEQLSPLDIIEYTGGEPIV